MFFVEFIDELDQLVDFFTSSKWEYLKDKYPTKESILKKFNDNFFRNEGVKSFWIKDDNNTIVGFIRIYDLDDGTPLFDLRINNSYSGKGIGTDSVKWINRYIFENYPAIDRIEGNTRQDNLSMRRVFEKTGYLKEAHYRKAWSDDSGYKYDAVGYAILREDWINKKVTNMIWNDL